MMHKVVVAGSLLFVLIAVIIGLGVEEKEMTEVNDKGWPTKASQLTDGHVPVGNRVLLELESGNVEIELYPNVAPSTVASFKALIAVKFYDGLVFHRVIPGFMAQGGDPDGSGMGDPGYKVKAEFSDRKHVRGTLSMARSGHPDSAGSQFFICFGPQPHLDGQYTIFGQVISGMNFVDELKVGSIMKKLTVHKD
ncbi:MAG: peptidylprolyl isomerase [Mariprofundaceae bacterium]|nr:peptidylprolyl isomerase [Mariprofundaceae bacterium]